MCAIGCFLCPHKFGSLCALHIYLNIIQYTYIKLYIIGKYIVQKIIMYPFQ